MFIPVGLHVLAYWTLFLYEPFSDIWRVKYALKKGGEITEAISTTGLYVTVYNSVKE